MGFLSVNISALVLAVKTYYLDSMFSASFGFRMFEFELKLPLIDEKAGVLKDYARSDYFKKVQCSTLGASGQHSRLSV